MFVQTKSSLSKNVGDSVETFVFKSKKNKKGEPSKQKALHVTPETKKKESNELDMKKLRYEVIKFGTSGFDGVEREESRVAFAVALGAKPPKKKCRNYVDILAEKKAQTKSKIGAKEQYTKKYSSTKGPLKRRQNKRKETGKLLDNYGKVRSD